MRKKNTVAFKGYLLNDRLSFEGKKQKTDTAKDSNKESKKLKKPFNFRINLINAAFNLFGGLAMMVAAVMPDAPGLVNNADTTPLNEPVQQVQVIEEYNHNAAAIEDAIEHDKALEIVTAKDSSQIVEIRAVEKAEATQQEQQQIQKDFKTFGQVMQDIGFTKTNLSQLGWLLTGMGTLITGPALISLGKKTKQPSTVASGASILFESPFIMMGSNAAFGLFLASLGMLSVGLGNIIENGSKPKEKPIEMNMDYLLDWKNWKNAFTSKDTAKKLHAEIAKYLKFEKDDARRVLVSVKDTATQFKDYATRKRKEKPDILTIKPSAEQRRTSSVFITVGGVVYAISMGPLAALAGIGLGLNSIGAMADNVQIYAGGKEEHSPAIMITAITKAAAETLLLKYPQSEFLMGAKIHSCFGFGYYYDKLEQKALKEKVAKEKESAAELQDETRDKKASKGTKTDKREQQEHYKDIQAAHTAAAKEKLKRARNR